MIKKEASGVLSVTQKQAIQQRRKARHQKFQKSRTRHRYSVVNYDLWGGKIYMYIQNVKFFILKGISCRLPTHLQMFLNFYKIMKKLNHIIPSFYLLFNNITARKNPGFQLFHFAHVQLLWP